MEDFYFGDRFYGSALHGDVCTVGCEAHTNFADESLCREPVNKVKKAPL
jgi:hypothetical protein